MKSPLYFLGSLGWLRQGGGVRDGLGGGNAEAKAGAGYGGVLLG